MEHSSSLDESEALLQDGLRAVEERLASLYEQENIKSHQSLQPQKTKLSVNGKAPKELFTHDQEKTQDKKVLSVRNQPNAASSKNIGVNSDMSLSYVEKLKDKQSIPLPNVEVLPNLSNSSDNNVDLSSIQGLLDDLTITDLSEESGDEGRVEITSTDLDSDVEAYEKSSKKINTVTGKINKEKQMQDFLRDVGNSGVEGVVKSRSTADLNKQVQLPDLKRSKSNQDIRK